MENQKLTFEYVGRGSQLFGLYLKNLILSIVTLGVYSFWGQVNIAKYIYSHTSLNQRQFGYHATGEERFVGFIKGAGILILIFGLIGALSAFFGNIGAIIGQLLMFIAFVALAPWLIIASRKYLLSRTSYSNIRFHFDAPLKELVILFFKGYFLTLITLGIYSPWFFVSLNRFLINHSSFGSLQFSYSGQGKEVFFLYLKGFLLTIITFGIYFPWFLASLTRYDINHSTLGESRFESELSGLNLLTIYLAILFSFGVFLPFAINYSLRVFTSKLHCFTNEEELKTIHSIVDPKASAFADGMSEAASVAESITGIF